MLDLDIWEGNGTIIVQDINGKVVWLNLWAEAEETEIEAGQACHEDKDMADMTAAVSSYEASV